MAAGLPVKDRHTVSTSESQRGPDCVIRNGRGWQMIAKELRLLLGTIAIACAALAGGQACAQGVTKTRILIGHSGPLSGSNQDFGVDIRDGALAYFEQVNQSGGIHGRRIDLDR